MKFSLEILIYLNILYNHFKETKHIIYLIVVSKYILLKNTQENTKCYFTNITFTLTYDL